MFPPNFNLTGAFPEFWERPKVEGLFQGSLSWQIPTKLNFVNIQRVQTCITLNTNSEELLRYKRK